MRRRGFGLPALATGIAVAVLSSLLLAAPVAADSPTRGPIQAGYSDTIAYASDAIEATLATTGATSISVALADHGRLVWRQAFGTTDGLGGTPTTATIYAIASVTKLLTTVAIMQLVDEGRVSLDRPVTDYVTEFRMADPAYRQITVRMLLNHTAGLPGGHYGNVFTTEPYAGYEQEVIDGLRGSNLKTTPGSMAAYCNDCFTVAAAVIERVTGVAFTQYVAEQILTPLEMTSSGFATTSPPPPAMAPVLLNGQPLPFDYVNALASGGLYATPSDMSHFASMLANGGTYAGRRILSAASVAQMGVDQTVTTLRPVPLGSFRYGLGWDTVREPALASTDIRGWQKGGDLNQYHSAVLVAPEEKMSVVVEAAGVTLSSVDLEELAQFIMLVALREEGRIDALPTYRGDTPLRVRPTAAQLRTMTGTYLGSGLQARVTANPDRSLTLSLNTTGSWQALPAEFSLRRDGQWWADAWVGYSISLARGWGRTYLVLNTSMVLGDYRDQQPVGQRVDSAPELSATWRARVGRTWVPVTELPTSLFWMQPSTTTFALIDDLPGFLTVTGFGGNGPVDPAASPNLASSFLVIPSMLGRDLDDVTVVQRDSQEWLDIGGTILRPLDDAPTLGADVTTITFGPEGYTEWRAVPTTGLLSTAGAAAWQVMDPDLRPLAGGVGDAVAVAVPTGGRVALFGSAGAQVSAVVAAGTRAG